MAPPAICRAAARETAKGRLGDGATGKRLRVVVGSDAHSSIVNTLRLLEMSALVVDTSDHRLTADAVNAALDADPDLSDVAAVVCTSGTTNAGIIDDLAGVGQIAKDRGWWFHVDGAYGGSGSLPDRCATSTQASSRQTRSSSTRTSGSSRLTAVRLSTGNLSSRELPILRTLPT